MNKPTAEEVFESMTGHEELYIKKRFGREAEDLAETSPIRMMRSLAFILEVRAGKDHKDAYDFVMNAKQKDITELFAEEDPAADIDPSLRVETELGKETASTIETLETSPAGAWSPDSPPISTAN